MRKLRHREAEQLAQVHTARSQLSWDWSTGTWLQSGHEVSLSVKLEDKLSQGK